MKYAHLVLSQGNKQTGHYVHRLVLETFVGPCPDGMESRHKDSDPFHNALSNLEWATHVDNIADKRERGTTRPGEQQKNSILTEAAVREIRSSKLSDRELADKFGVSRSTVTMVRLRKRWKHIK